MNTTKEEILERIETLEAEIIKLKKLSQSESFDVKTWDDLEVIDGYYIKTDSKIVEYSERICYEFDKNVFKTKRHALSALAMAQISQLMPYYGGEITADEWYNGRG